MEPADNNIKNREDNNLHEERHYGNNIHEHHHGKHAGHHHHHHHPDISGNESMRNIFIFCIALNLLFVGIEAGVGIIYNSVGLLSDAGHNLSDVFSLLLVLVAFRMSKAAGNRQFTYGYKKATILISLLNALILLVAVGAILLESIYKLRNPEPISGSAISWTAGIGIIINGITTKLLMSGKEKDINVKGAYLHMLMDTLVSVGVVISGIVINCTGWNQIDPIIGIVLALIILASTYSLLKESLLMTMDAVPSSVNIKTIEMELNSISEVKSWHHLHIWAISTTENAATIHVVINRWEDIEEAKLKVKNTFRNCGVNHCTVEIESEGTICPNSCC